MGYQALLFCPDEKLARVVSQVFSELDFGVDPVHEPFAAVKQLMAHHYDAIVVDCENEQNASLLLRSARNSKSNQNSLALALVEGQTGVAKAYRIGANLVLTKPINLEQAKGTLRVARGLLRKSSEATLASATSLASSPAAAKNYSATSSNSTYPTTGGPVAAMAAAATHELPELVPAPAPGTPVVRPMLTERGSLNAAAAAPPIAHNRIVIASEPADDVEETVSSIGINNDEAGRHGIRNVVDHVTTKGSAGSALAHEAASTAASASGSAAAAAPAPVVTTAPETESKGVEAKYAGSSRNHSTPAALVPMDVNGNNANAPTFGGLSPEDSAGSSRTKKILIAAMIVLALATLGYLSNGRLGKFGTAPESQPASAPRESSQPAPALKPMSTPAETPATAQPEMAGASSSSSVRQAANAGADDKPSAGAGNSPAIKIAPDTVPETKRKSSAPLVVASHSAAKTQQADDSAPLPPTTFVAAAGSNSNLSALMSSASYSGSKPSLVTLKVSQGVSQGLLIKRVQPKYPAAALAVHSQGSVQIEATIDKDGNVVNPKVLKGDPVFTRTALDAVRQWRYKPYFLDGTPVEIQTQITINFKAN